MTEPVRSRLRVALREAMKARDDVAVSALRAALGAIDNAEAVDHPGGTGPMDGVIAGAVSGVGSTEVARLELTDAQVLDLVRGEVAERRATAASFRAAGQVEHADHLVAEADALDALLSSGG